MPPTAQLARMRERIEDLFREIGTLVLAFTPLDAIAWVIATTGSNSC
jgi:hypothetical protein